MREKVFFIGLVLLLVAFCGCSESNETTEAPAEFTLNGTVTDEILGGPVAGASVSIYWKKITDMDSDDDTVVDQKEAGFVITGIDGKFTLNLTVLGKDEYYFISCAHMDYWGGSKRLDFSDYSDPGSYQVEIKMTRQLRLQGVVKSVAGAAVPGAAVVYYALDGSGDCRVGGYNLTSSAGEFLIKDTNLLSSSIIVSAPGFESTILNITLKDYATNLTIKLKEGSYNASVNGSAYDYWLKKDGANMAILAQAETGQPATAACISGPDGKYQMQLDSGRYKFMGKGYYEFYDLDTKYLEIDPEYHTLAEGNNSVDLYVDFHYPEG